MNEQVYIFMGILVGLIIGYLLAKIYFMIKVKRISANSVQRSRSVILGEVNEKIAPILPDFPYNYKDMVFIGKGIDYLIFDGLSNGQLEQIVFMEIKSGKSNLNKNEKSIKDRLEKRMIKYEIFKI